MKIHKSIAQALVFALPLLILLQSSAAPASEAKSVVITVAEKSVGEAVGLALRLAAKRGVKMDAVAQKSIIDSEVIPNSSQYVSSYRVVGGGPRGLINLNATIDLRALQSILAFGSEEFARPGAKVQVMVRGFKGGAPWQRVPYEETEEPVVARVEAGFKEILARRKLQALPRINSYMEHLENVDGQSASLLRGVATRQKADFVIFVAASFVQDTDDESTYEGQRLQLEASFFDQERNLILGTAKESIPLQAGERALSAKNEKVLENVTELVARVGHGVFLRSGSRFLTEVSADKYLTLRIQDPPNHAAIQELKEAITKINKVNSVVEREIQRGRLDLWVDAALSADALRKEIRSLALENFRAVLRPSESGQDPELTVMRLEPKGKEETR